MTAMSEIHAPARLPSVRRVCADAFHLARPLCSASLATGALLMLAGVPAMAQDVAQNRDASEVRRGVPVDQRPRPELDPQGTRQGAFLIFPKLELSQAYNDNIYASENNTRSDWITVLAPSLRVQSDWNRHALALSTRAAIGRYLDRSDENYEDYFLNGNGRLDITRRAQLTGRLGYSALHEDRGEPTATGGVKPTEYSLTNAEAAFRQQFNRVNVRLGGAFQRFDYDDDRTPAGAVINNQDRDRDVKEASLRVGYEIVPEYEAFVRGTYNDRDYNSRVDDAGFNRDSDGYEAVAGIRLDLSGITFGDVFAGYREQSYDDARLPTVSGPTFGAGITWNATALTTARLNVSRSVEETTTANASGYLATRYAVRVDHELLRNLLVGGNAAYTLNDYEGISRKDDNYAAGLYGKYMMNRNVHTRLSWDHRRRDSNAAGNDFKQNVMMLRLDLQL